MKKKLSLLLFCLLPMFFYANGGIPYNFIENGPAKISLVNDKDLILEKEHLTIKFEDDFALVTCEYELKNNTDKDKTVNFAFNIPITVGTYLSEKYSLIYYGIFDNNILIPYTSKTECLEEGPFENYYDLWKISELNFSSNELKKLKVIYKQRTDTSGTIVNEKYGNNLFRYNLFPATSFGNGIIKDFNLTIDKSELILEEGKIVKISGLDITDDVNNFISEYSFKNFDLTKNKELVIEYDINGFYIGNFIKNEYSYVNWFHVGATSELKEGKTVYSRENLRDGDYSTAWVEASSDFGSKDKLYIEVIGNPEKWRSEDYKRVSHLYILNGFRKNEKTYYENNRLKKIRIVSKGKSYGEFTFPDRPYKQINDFNFAYEAELLDFKSVIPSEFYIEILEVYPGTKYNDTCISEIILLNVPLPSI